jgi:hypothetical protein
MLVAEFRISGIWKDSKGVISHYAIHTTTKTANGYTIGYTEKYSKHAAVQLLLKSGNSVKTYLWNYSSCCWYAGADILLTDGQPLFKL